MEPSWQGLYYSCSTIEKLAVVPEVITMTTVLKTMFTVVQYIALRHKYPYFD
jgi:hypothetical protein